MYNCRVFAGEREVLQCLYDNVSASEGPNSSDGESDWFLHVHKLITDYNKIYDKSSLSSLPEADASSHNSYPV